MRFALILVFMLALFAFSVSADGNQTSNQTTNTSESCNLTYNWTEICANCTSGCNVSCPAPNASLDMRNVSFDFTISPGENIADAFIFDPDNVTLNYNIQCIACSQEQSDICSIDKSLDAGEDYSRHTELCDVEVSCTACDEAEIIRESCPNGTQTVELPFIMQTRNQDRELVIHVGDTEAVMTVGKGMDYSSTLEVACPETYAPQDNTNRTFEECKAFSDNLCINPESTNTMVKYLSATILRMQNSSDNTGAELAVCRDDRDKYLQDRNNRDDTIQSLEGEKRDLQDNITALQNDNINLSRDLYHCEKEDKNSSLKVSVAVFIILFVLSFIGNVILVIWISKLKMQGVSE